MSTPSASATAIASRDTTHYPEMDLLRGVAAIIVVLYHLGERVDLPLLFAHGYLGVDFFFALSGFVLAHAYSEKLSSRRLGLSKFFFVRFVRLMPMVALGITIGAGIELVRPTANATAHGIDVALAWLKGCLLIPIMHASTLEYLVFPLNGPVWSLFFEVVANIVFALALITGVMRSVGVVIFALGLLAIIWFADTHDTLGQAGAVADLFVFGFPRVALSFGLGLGLYHIRQHATFTFGRLKIVIALALVCLVPPLPGGWNGVFEIAAILFLLPSIIFAAANYTHERTANKLVELAGLISYPIYLLHYPFVRAIGFIVQRLNLSVPLQFFVTLVFTSALIGLAFLCERYYDAPIRRWLSSRLVQH